MLSFLCWVLVMPKIVCEACGGVIFDSGMPFAKLPKQCVRCGCRRFCAVSEDDLERERLRALEASGCLISSLLES